MTITQTIDIPADGRFTFEIPPQKQASRARVIIQFPISEDVPEPNRKPISQFFGILSPDTYGDGVAYQRKLRDEWND
jgi:hypothetical protein